MSRTKWLSGSTSVHQSHKATPCVVSNILPGFGLANFLFTFPAYLKIDSGGRRFLLLTSLGGTGVSLLMISSFFYVKDPETQLGLVATFFIVLFTFFYSIGTGPIPFTLSAEVFPLALRGEFHILARTGYGYP